MVITIVPVVMRLMWVSGVYRPAVNAGREGGRPLTAFDKACMATGGTYLWSFIVESAATGRYQPFSTQNTNC